MKKIFAIISAVFFLSSVTAKAEVQFGLGVMYGQLSTSGTETEGTAADTSVRSKDFDEQFFGADVFVEFVHDSGITLGVSYVPMDFELGSGSRTDTAVAAASGGAENDTGTRKAQADVTDLMGIYTNIPVGSSGFYGLLGASMATITTSETLNESSYGNKDVKKSAS